MDLSEITVKMVSMFLLYQAGYTEQYVHVVVGEVFSWIGLKVDCTDCPTSTVYKHLKYYLYLKNFLFPMEV